MKRMFVFVFALFVIGQVTAKAVDPKKPEGPEGVSVLTKGNVVQLFYRNAEADKVEVAIYSEKGRLVFREVIRNREEFMRPYNFAGLPDGVYTIEIDDENGKRYQTVMHRKKPVEKVAHLTRLKEDPSRYVLLVPGRERDVLTIKIFGDDNRLLHREVKTTNGDFAGLYHLENFSGNAVFEVTDSSGRVTRLSKS